MVGPIALTAALSRLVAVRCPWCGHQKLVSRQPVAHRVCPRCKKHFPDRLAPRARKR
jgi:transposase-like protein